jgi:hypothetical protein
MCRSAGAVLAALWFALAGCTAASPAPASARRTMDQAQRDPRGAWINVVTDRGGVAGELLAVEARALIVLSTVGFQRVPIDSVRGWSLAWYDADNAGVIAYGVVGTLSTLSHGWWAVFTAPLLWMIPSPIMARAQSKQGYESGNRLAPDEHLALARYARFPAGLPPGFDPTVPPAEGGLDQPCYPNQTCNSGLTCDRAVCRHANPPSPPGPPP